MRYSPFSASSKFGANCPAPRRRTLLLRLCARCPPRCGQKRKPRQLRALAISFFNSARGGWCGLFVHWRGFVIAILTVRPCAVKKILTAWN
jgi:hypothetical protein